MNKEKEAGLVIYNTNSSLVYILVYNTPFLEFFTWTVFNRKISYKN